MRFPAFGRMSCDPMANIIRIGSGVKLCRLSAGCGKYDPWFNAYLKAVNYVIICKNENS